MDQLIESFKASAIPAVEKNIEATQEAYGSIQGSDEAPSQEQAEIVEVPVATVKIPEYRPKLGPCEADCPAGEKIKNTIHFIRYGHFEDALESIKAENPFPGICGRVCFHPCETNCNRVKYDEGIATNALERAAFTHADRSKMKKVEKKPTSGKKAAVIGSGPAGMTCAYYLALLGHSVTVFEAQPVAGGVPRFGIPEYRLPKKVVDQEISDITDLGVDIKLNTKVGKDVTFEAINKEYDATFIGAGAHRSMELGIPGEDSKGVLSGLEFLKRVTLGEKVTVGSKVAVIGGGNTAVDSARTAKRLGAGEVIIVYRRTAEEMPAFQDEVIAAEKEGIAITYLAIPVKVRNGENGASKLECVKAELGEPDDSGRRRPMPIEGSNFMIEVDTIITALGETLELPFPDGTVKLSGSVIKVDNLGRTSINGVYAGGDVASLTRSVVEAIASGKRAAMGIDFYLTGRNVRTAKSFREGPKNTLSMGRYLTGNTTSDSNEVVSYENLNLAYFTEEPRYVMPELPAKTRTKDFSETNLGFSREGAIAEADRCFQCGTCTLCEVCFISCPDAAISLKSDGLSFTITEKGCRFCGICIYECPRNAISWKGAE
ncbi:NAD(P)-binding protein [Chloroflexota bacterium]